MPYHRALGHLPTLTYSLLLVSLPCLVPFAGCGGDGGANPGDGGTAADAAPDTGQSPPDAGQNPPDAGRDPACEGASLTQSGALDLDIRAVTIAGKVTLNGKPLPAGAGGRLTFTERTTRVNYELPLASSYRAVFAPGEYDVAISSGGCTGKPTDMPCLGGTVRERVSFAKDGPIDIDIPTVAITGKVTLNGRALTDVDASLGSLFWYNAQGEVRTFDLPTNADRTYAITVVPGTYSVDLGTKAFACDDKVSQFPCIGKRLKDKVALTSNGNLDIDVRSAHITSNITLNGKALPDMGAARGYINLGDRNHFIQFPLDKSGPLKLSLWVAQGSYAVAYQPAQQCSGGGETAFPCTTAEVLAATEVTSDRALDVNIPTVNVQGAITLRGKPMSGGAGRGQLRIFTDWGGSTDVDFTASAAKSYTVTLAPGTYSVLYQSSPSCDDTWVLPCNRGLVRSKVEIARDGAVDVDIPAVRVTGTVTLNGKPLPDLADDRGAVIVSPTGSDDFLDNEAILLGNKGAKTFARTVLPGSYSIKFHPNTVLCTNPSAPDSVFPCAGGALKREVALSSDGPLEIDIPTVSIQGSVSFNGKVVPDANQDRGKLGFGFIGGEQGDIKVFPATGAVSYRTTLLPGYYKVLYQPNVYLCRPDSPFPCTDEVLKGCETAP